MTKGSDALTPAALVDTELAGCLGDLPFGIGRTGLIADAAVDAINAKEAAAVAARRSRYEISTVHTNAVGLGLSGGGIRSATFCLGVAQVLAERDLLRDVDFLSTVSGGGFVGCFLTMRLGRAESYADVAGPHGPDPVPIRYVRQNAKYLSASNLKERWSMVTATFAGMILNWTAPLFLITLAALFALSVPPIPWPGLLLVASAATAASLLLYAFGMRYERSAGGPLLGITTSITLFIAVLWLLARAYGFVAAHIGITAGWGLTGLVAAGVTAFPTIVRFIPFIGRPNVRRIVLRMMLILAGLIVPLGGIALTFWFYHLGGLPLDPTASAANPLHYTDGWAVLAIVTVLFGLVAFFLLDINATSPHRLYRNLLARTFIYQREDDVTGRHFPTTDSSPTSIRQSRRLSSAPSRRRCTNSPSRSGSCAGRISTATRAISRPAQTCGARYDFSILRLIRIVLLPQIDCISAGATADARRRHALCCRWYSGDGMDFQRLCKTCPAFWSRRRSGQNVTCS